MTKKSLLKPEKRTGSWEHSSCSQQSGSSICSLINKQEKPLAKPHDKGVGAAGEILLRSSSRQRGEDDLMALSRPHQPQHMSSPPGTAATDCGLLAPRDVQPHGLGWHLSASTHQHPDQPTDNLSLIGHNSTG